MTDKEFKDAVYKKYNAYKLANVECDFIKRYSPKHTRSVLVTVIIIAILATLVISTTAASYYFTNIWKEPEPYNYDEEKEVTEQHYEKSITESEAKAYATDYILKFTGTVDEISSCELVNEPIIDETFWHIDTKKGHYIQLKGNNGSLVSINFADKVATQSNVAYNDVKGISEKLLNKFGYLNKGYELAYLADIGSGLWQADYCMKYNEVFNPYQCIRLRFSPLTEQLLLIRIFDEPFENNPYVITKEQAIDLVKKEIGTENIKTISAEQTIEKMNALLYQEKNEGLYRTEQIVRNIWLIKFIKTDTEWEEMYYVDGTTGEFIGGDKMK
jgi:hypothetical protein